ncbi:hypothetical protein FHX42_003910 [Saccharopolyspora lacisalsi]|uniref:Uncharacterized protein n=1 Tax=Halosaccharopolyspora lacisalsi TaxID=1000566 RepID=A0A839DYH0_9PSEU|nr:hypothetical protein [Halosaccharopolyspora lacisalsi]MBA8826534.1 hypothetical protein [Halosaccharopolyspora lacisalsi]
MVRHGEVLPLPTCYTERERHARHGAEVVHDCLLPAGGEGRQRRSSFVHIYPAEVRRWVHEHRND